MASVRLKGLVKSFRDKGKKRKALDNFSLEVKEGESLSVVGPTGCGKTTLLKVIAGLVPVDEGEIYFDEEPMIDVAARDRGIGMVFQSYALYPHFKSRDNLAFYFRLRRWREKDINEEVRATSRIMGIGFEALLGRFPRNLSGGERQRVALARCIIRKPRIFLLDEPISNLDAKLRNKTRHEIRKLLKQFKITTIYVTHDQKEAIFFGDRIAVMREGRLEQVGTFNELYSRPVNVFVASFLGEPGMNFFRGKFSQGYCQLDLGDYWIKLPPQVADRIEEGFRIIVGLRPEHLTVSKEGGGGLEAVVEGWEPLLAAGKQAIFLRIGKEEAMAINGMQIGVKVEELVSIHPDESKVIVFNAETEETIY
ncbi:ABC transporter ATP-binding protein [candidate division NPL-UPA2 bacterium]|nr:ABC transporter ATP-binding protein [candidate division NPL-UPA2 bacterium]